MRRDIYSNSFEYYESDGYQLKFWIKKLIEDYLTKVSEGRRDLKVADVNFAYHNSWLIDGLRKRGTCIKFQKWEQLNELNRELTARLHGPNPNGSGTELNNVTMPKCVFISYESEEAYNFMNDMTEFEIAGEISKVSEAPEPTNVIWENRDLDKRIRVTNLVYITIAVAVVLFITFLATVKAKAMTNELVGKYDESVNCSEMHKMYQRTTLMQLASDEWLEYYSMEEDAEDRLIAPTLTCFCSAEYEEEGADAAEKMYKSSEGKDVKTCSEIFADRAAVGMIAMGVSFLIVGVNFALKVLLVELIKSLRLKTVTLETNYTMITIFVGQFINTAVLIVLNNASFEDFDGGKGPLSAIFTVGTETDFSVLWYATVGKMIMATMMSQALWPLIEFGMFYSLINFNRCLDRSFTNDTFNTKAPSVQAYIDLYAGPVYLIHYRYAAILLQIGVAFCYGCTMPPLYIIACLAFVILYINERLLVCYYYREPPAFDEKMTVLTLDLVKWVPFIMLPMAFWQLGNRQIFESEVAEIDFKADIRLSKHDISNSLSHMDPTYMTYNSGPLWILLLILVYRIVSKFYCPDNDDDDDDGLVEGLADYYDALKDADKACLIGQEEYFKRY